MSPRYVIDADVVLGPICRPRDGALIRRLRRHEDEIAVGAPTWLELDRACRRLTPSWERDVLERYLDEVVRPSFPVLPYDGKAAAWQASIRPGPIDGTAVQVAAIAASGNLTLVTCRPDRYAALGAVAVEDWRGST